MTEEPTPIFRFPSRPEWGRGFLVQEREGKRYYDFEDGERHVLLERGWVKLEEVELPDDERATLERKLKGIALRKEAVAKKSRKSAAGKKPAACFADQLALFEARFPGGFLGEAYIDSERAPADRRGPKGYKERILRMAKTSLGSDDLSRLRSERDFVGILERVRRIMQSAFTLMHPQSDVIPFSKLAEEHHEAYGEALFDLLHGEGEYGPRFDRYVEILAQEKITWPLASFPSAVFCPSEHLFVKAQPLEDQAKTLGMKTSYDPEPTAEAYAKMHAVGEEVRKRLTDAGHAPRDLLDVYTFIWLTRHAPPVHDERSSALPPSS